VPGSDVHARNQVHAVEGLARRNGFKGDHNVVRASEFESVAQTISFSPHQKRHGTPTAGRIGTTTLYSNSTTKG
jgi:hypothetical protein